MVRPMAETEHSPGTPAPQDGTYHQVNVFGTPTGATVFRRQGETLPHAPRGFGWRRGEVRMKVSDGIDRFEEPHDG